jgi:hypothetical protein
VTEVLVEALLPEAALQELAARSLVFLAAVELDGLEHLAEVGLLQLGWEGLALPVVLAALLVLALS